MPPRKKVKGTKPKETMRQRQRRLLREQRAKAASNRVKQKALPPIGESGGSKPPKGTKKPGTTRGTGPGRRQVAAAKRAGASMGSRGTGVRVAGGSAPSYARAGASAAARAGRGALGIAKNVLRGAARLVAGRDDGSGSALMAAMAANDAINAARGSTAKDRNKPKRQGPPAPKFKKNNYKTAQEFIDDPKYKKVKRKKK
jgi:hypothetical protein|tara:strand:- start:787 stop:1386 length:600 start_codon:yes stop_codon:yes gene_type:complete